MERIERKYPQLINCFGRIDYEDKQCNKCKYAFYCHNFGPTLQSPDFLPGKYREGFGKQVRSVKRSWR